MGGRAVPAERVAQWVMGVGLLLHGGGREEGDAPTGVGERALELGGQGWGGRRRIQPGMRRHKRGGSFRRHGAQ